MKSMRFTRREVLASPPVCRGHGISLGAVRGAGKTVIAIFSKPLNSCRAMNWRRAQKRLGFEGIDLAVRKGGHVEPERVREDFPSLVSHRSAGRGWKCRC